SVVIGLAAAVGFRYFAGPVPLLAWLRPKTVPGHALMESAGIGALGGLGLGALYMVGVHFLGLGAYLYEEETTNWALDVGFYVGMLGIIGWRGVQWDRLKESVVLTVRTSAMVCWLFVGSWTFSSVFSYLGGHSTIEHFVLGLDLQPVYFLIMAQIIIFLLGWPLEWSEIIIIFVPIFLPMLDNFGIDPLFFGILVALNLQTSFLTPPMAMAAYYLKGIAPPHITLMTIFRGCMPFLGMVLIAMILLYNFPGIALWLPDLIYKVR
ncbi:MAG: TRAP transporter large permease subunit, partial [Alphaproteobacteria bacterium]